jgi:hypothetical protein
MDIGKYTNPITLLAAAIAAIVSTYMSVQYGPALKKLEVHQTEINALLSQQNLEQGEEKFDRDFKFSIIDRVFTAIGSGNKEQISVALAMVKTMLGNDPETQKELLNAIANTPDASAADQLKATVAVENIVRFDSVQVVTAMANLTDPPKVETPTNDGSKWRFDVFFGEGKAKVTQGKAEHAMKALKDLYPEAQVRMRDLPEVVNAREGYNVKGNEIRFDPDEIDKAKQIQQAMEKAGLRMQLHESKSRTAGYISVFVVE